MQRGALVILVVAVALAGGPRVATACSCPGGFPKSVYADRAAMVFTGVVTSVSGSPLGLACSADSADSVPATFDVETVYKGDVPPTITVHPIGDAKNCGSMVFKVGRRYTVFPAAGQTDRVYALACGGEVEGAIVPADYGLAAGHPPRR